MKKNFLLIKLFMCTAIISGILFGCSSDKDEESDMEVLELLGTWRYDFSTGYVLGYFGKDGYGWQHEYDEEDGGWYDKDYFDYTYDASSKRIVIIWEDGYKDFIKVLSLTDSKLVCINWGDDDGESETWKRLSYDEVDEGNEESEYSSEDLLGHWANVEYDDSETTTELISFQNESKVVYEASKYDGDVEKEVIAKGTYTLDGNVINMSYNDVNVYSSDENRLFWGFANNSSRKVRFIIKSINKAKMIVVDESGKQMEFEMYEPTTEDEDSQGGNNDENSEYSDLKQDELDAKDEKRGHVSKGFSKGAGTSSDPYIISSAAELRYFSDAVREGNIFKDQYIKLGADITINQNVLTRYGELNGDGSNFEPWIPIGRYNPSYFFCGTFDGNGYTISGLYCNRPEGEDVGFFGKLYGNIKNVVIKDSYFKGKNNVGGVVGNTRPNYDGSTIPTSVKEYYQNEKTISITSCVNEAMVSGESGIGGIVGFFDSVKTISQCINDGYIVGNSNVGGIVGKSTTLSGYDIIDCCNKGYIRGLDNNGSSIGGILGNGYLDIYNCLNLGDVKSAGKTVGGICGIIGKSKSRQIMNCVNISSEIKGTNQVGAILGFNNGITVSYNYYLFENGLNAVGDSYNGSNSNNSSLTEDELRSMEIIDKLNKRVKTGWSKWKSGDDSFPILEWME